VALLSFRKEGGVGGNANMRRQGASLSHCLLTPLAAPSPTSPCPAAQGGRLFGHSSPLGWRGQPVCASLGRRSASSHDGSTPGFTWISTSGTATLPASRRVLFSSTRPVRLRLIWHILMPSLPLFPIHHPHLATCCSGQIGFDS
jgi:hypothetical protein